MRYTPRGGKITLGSERRGERIILSVQDTGAGIAPKDLPHIFDRFYRADPSRHQADDESGLGLAIARSLVMAQGGEISVESELGRGTNFEIALPATICRFDFLIFPQYAQASSIRMECFFLQSL